MQIIQNTLFWTLIDMHQTFNSSHHAIYQNHT